MSPLKREQGQKLANKIRAVKYMECSALTQRGLKQVSDSFFSLVYSIVINLHVKNNYFKSLTFCSLVQLISAHFVPTFVIKNSAPHP